MSMPLTVKGQVTIPKAIRDHLGLVPGARVRFDVSENGDVMLRRATERGVAPDRFERLVGSATAGLTTDEIMAMTRGED